MSLPVRLLIRRLNLFLSGALATLAAVMVCTPDSPKPSHHLVQVHPSFAQMDFVVTLANGLRYFGSTADKFDLMVLYHAEIEQASAAILALLADITPKDTPRVFLDVGAHVGLHSLAMSRHVDKVIAIEPFPPVLKRLYRNIKGNNITNIEVKEVGFGHKNSTLDFVLPPGHLTTIGTFSNDVYAHSKAGFAEHHRAQLSKQNLKLPIRRGDDVLAGAPVSILKIDIEGYERYGLMGLGTTLKTHRPAVVMELNVNQDGGFTNKTQFLEVFPPDYHFFLIADEKLPLQIVPFDFSFPQGRYRQIVAIPDSLREAWSARISRERSPSR